MFQRNAGLPVREVADHYFLPIAEAGLSQRASKCRIVIAFCKLRIQQALHFLHGLLY